MGIFKMRTPKTEEVAPTPQAVQSSDTSMDIESNTKKKKRAGFSSTQGSSLLDTAGEGGRTTLG